MRRCNTTCTHREYLGVDDHQQGLAPAEKYRVVIKKGGNRKKVRLKILMASQVCQSHERLIALSSARSAIRVRF